MKRILIALGLAALLIGAVGQAVWADQSAAEKRQLFREGAQLWPVYCAQCHNARPGSEFAPYQWDAIMMHMRTQANLPAKDARAILEYLKASH
jgi:mono/diheme cytochrome c family protein